MNRYFFFNHNPKFSTPQTSTNFLNFYFKYPAPKHHNLEVITMASAKDIYIMEGSMRAPFHTAADKH